MGLHQESNGHWGVQQLTERLLSDHKELGLRLFSAAWQAWPDSRTALLANISHDSIWSLPEVFAHGRTDLLPTGETTVESWHGIADHVEIKGQGIVTGTLTRMLQVPVSTERAEQFLNDVHSALATQPTWTGGKIYAALLQAHLGDTDTVIRQFTDLLQHQLADMPPMVVWVTACELHRIGNPSLNTIIVQLLERLHAAQESGVVLFKSGGSWHTSPDYLLVQVSAANSDVETVRTVMRRLTLLLNASRDNDITDSIFNDLIASIEHYLPEEAQYLRRVHRFSSPDSSNLTQTEATDLTEERNEVIQVIRERLLRQQP